MDAEPERPVVQVFRDSRTTADQERAIRDNRTPSAPYTDRPGSERWRSAAWSTSRRDPCRSPW